MNIFGFDGQCPFFYSLFVSSASLTEYVSNFLGLPMIKINDAILRIPKNNAGNPPK